MSNFGKAIVRLKKWSKPKDIDYAIDKCRREGYRSLDLYAAALACACGDFKTADRYVNGPCSSTEWGGSGKGAIAEIRIRRKAKQ